MGLTRYELGEERIYTPPVFADSDCNFKVKEKPLYNQLFNKLNVNSCMIKSQHKIATNICEIIIQTSIPEENQYSVFEIGGSGIAIYNRNQK